jgi:glutaredoxin
MFTLPQLQTISQMENVIFYKPNCPFCFATRVLFDRLVKDKVLESYSVYIIDTDFDNPTFAEFIQTKGWSPTAASPYPSKPQIFIKGEYIAGNADFYNSKWNKGNGMPNLPLTVQIQNTMFAMSALKAWEEGEKTGNYDKFKGLISPDFELFSHPIVGKFVGRDALIELNKMIRDREQNSNNLEFSNIKFTLLENTFVYEFDSNGSVTKDKIPYSGHNMIKIIVNNGKIIGFQEYFGDIKSGY